MNKVNDENIKVQIIKKYSQIELNGIIFSDIHTHEEIEDLFFKWLEESKISYGGIMEHINE